MRAVPDEAAAFQIQAKMRSKTPRRRMTTKAFILGHAANDFEDDMGLVPRLEEQLDAVGEEARHEGKRPPGRIEDSLRPVAILDVGAVDLDRAQPAVGVDVGQDAPLAATEALSGVTAFALPFRSAVRTLWRSRIAAEGDASRPGRTRPAMTRVWSMPAQTLSRSQRRRYQ
ncbi:hypothetical protein CNY89_15875 [Amaricoccus sp. HAR-UPW-R2A-40]|nr:hypothetical protein CNY89_15875 [Amaricoccus sp. HAR-UPW-R2A-40]